MKIECRVIEKITEIIVVEPIADEEIGLELNEENVEKCKSSKLPKFEGGCKLQSYTKCNRGVMDKYI
ncbi:hypothetical protein MANES_13G117402v8 [Manihot esculenta]|uniref:Uncharacterized protein n=1 Tax=Manihot esculenta TaxID=3983 RepID=A0ACB7GMP3_MANES|nr:hypothetical protein MANES_13G117402v8 [Manihot esculenta]